MLANALPNWAIWLLASVLAAASVIALSTTPTNADHDPGGSAVDIIAVDADPSGNSALVVGAIDPCVSVTSGTPFDIDVVVDQVPAAGGYGFGFDLTYDESIVAVTASDPNQMVVATEPTAPFMFQDSLPDSDGNFRIDMYDFGGVDESGEGVLVRLTLNPIASGLSALTLSNAHISDGAYEVTNVFGGFAAVDAPCPAATNIAVTAASASSPAAATAGQAFSVTVGGTVVNNGPAANVNVDVAASLAMPGDCSATGGPQQTAQDLLLTTGSPVNIPTLTFDVTCTSPSNHSFTASLLATIDDPDAIDVQGTDDQLASSPTVSAITANADISVASVAGVIDVPEVRASMQFSLDVTVSLANATALGPMPVTATVGLTLPADCRIYSNNPRQLNTQLPPSGGTPAQTQWLVICDLPGEHTFVIDAAIAGGEHVSDTTANNNTGSVSVPFRVKAGFCGPDPDPQGDLIANLSPLLLSTISDLTASGPEIVEEDKTQLDCQLTYSLMDAYGAGATDCPASSEPQPCGMNIGVSIEILGGSPTSEPTTRLLPNTVYFIPSAFDWATDASVPNGTVVGEGHFSIRTDAALAPNNVPCQLDVNFAPVASSEGGIRGNVPESNAQAALKSSTLWPNDLNGERLKVEAALELIPGVPTVQLWSRTIVPLNVSGTELPLNVLTWKVTDALFSTVVGAEWIFVAFPGDAVNPDPVGAIGGDPDADDPVAPVPQITCAPHQVSLTWNGLAGNVPMISCATAGSPMVWGLVDPDAVNISKDQGPRSKVAPCTADADSDGLTPAAEAAFGTDPNDPDTDGDGVEDASDNCRLVYNPTQADNDADSLPNECDNCPGVSNLDQANADGDDAGDACDLCPTVATEWVVSANDADCDGFTETVESFVGTLVDTACSTTSDPNDEEETDRWPVDLDDNQRANTVDVLKYVPVLNTVAPDPGYNSRMDLNGDSRVNTLDVLRFVPFLNKTCA